MALEFPIELEFRNVDFCEGRKQWRKQGRRNQQQTQPTYDTGSRIWTRATLVGGERYHHCATPATPVPPLLPLCHPWYPCATPATPQSLNHWLFWICVWGKLGQGNHVIIVTSSFSKSSVFKVFPTRNPAFSDSSNLKSVFEKLRFWDGFVWTAGLTVETELRFEISYA